MGKPVTSSFSVAGNCVEVYDVDDEDVVVVRNTRARSVESRFTRADWDAFIKGVKGGEFDQFART